MGKVVLSYSAAHFDPLKIKKPVGGSGVIAKTFFEALQKSYKNSDVVYIDYRDKSALRGVSDVEIILGLSENLHSIRRAINPDRTILLAVNKPWYQRRKILDKALEARYPLKALSTQDGLRSNSHELKISDQVISLGSFANYQEYSELMGTSELVFPISFNPYGLKSRIQKRDKTILVFCGEISFRKGIDVLESLIPHIAKNGYLLKIVGNTSNAELRTRLEQLEITYGENFLHEKSWITFGSDKWSDLIDDVTFSIFPSREEGQASVLAELISEGIPIIYTENSGLDWTLNLEQPNNYEITSWTKILDTFFNMSEMELKAVSTCQQQILKLNGREALQISKLVSRISNGGFWPGVYVDYKEVPKTPIVDSYVVNRNYVTGDPILIDLNSYAEIQTQSLNRDLVAIVDRYQKYSEFLVKYSDQIYRIGRVNQEKTSLEDPQNIRIEVKISSELISKKRTILLMRTIGPWLCDRRFMRLYKLSFMAREGFANLVWISRARSKNSSAGNRLSKNQTEGKKHISESPTNPAHQE